MIFSAKKTLRKISDEDLVIMLSKGNSAAFEELYRRFSKRLLNFLLHMLSGNSARAQDILQDVFLRLIEKADLFRPQYRAGSWLFTIAGNLCKNEYRRLSRTSGTAYETSDGRSLDSCLDELEIIESLDKKKFEKDLYRKLYHMPPENRSTFLLRFQEGLSVKEIAGIMECPEGTVKSRLHYTVKKLAKSLQAYNPEIEFRSKVE